LLALTAAVLGAHALLLRPLPGAFQPARERARPLITRTVAPQPVALEVAAAPATAAPAMPARPRAAPSLTENAARREKVQATATSPAPTAMPTSTPAPRADVLVAAVPSAQPPSQPAAPKRSAAEKLAVAVPGSVLLHYKVTAHARGLTLNGQGQLHWRHDGNDYDAKLVLSGALLPSRTQQSTGRITAQGLAPLRFSDKARREEAAHFQRDVGKVSFSNNQPDAVLSDGAQDRLSVMLQLGAVIAGKPNEFGPGATISIQTASTRDAEVWQFTVEGKETLQLPGGELQALKLIRNPRKEFDQKVELWLAPGMAYVPVRLRLTQPNGDWVDQQWSSTDKG
jgi:hypothetical protein